jgi:hypothetical protein
MTMTCTSCRFWSEIASGRGACRRNAPRCLVEPVMTPRDSTASWPQTWHDDWCGEYEAASRNQPPVAALGSSPKSTSQP